MEERIVLDRKSFEALAVDSRVRILKSLKERRKTLSEIAREHGMSVSGTKEHLSNLEKVGLIEKIDDGHKWKYYELTGKGKEIVGPKEVRVWILLSSSIFALIISAMMLFNAPLAVQDAAAISGDAEGGAVNVDGLPKATAMDTLEYAAPLMASADRPMNETDDAGHTDAMQTISAQNAPDTSIPLAVAGISSLSILACLGILARNRLTASSL